MARRLSRAVAPTVVDLRGKLPRRIISAEPDLGGDVTNSYAAPYGTRPLSAIEVLAVHYPGDPAPDGSVDGYGEMTAEQVAKYQVEKTTGDLYPEVAYPLIVHLDGRIDVCLGDPDDPNLIASALKVESWHVGEQNPRCVGVLLTGIGKLGRPTEAQERSIMWLGEDISAAISVFGSWTLDLKGHQEVGQSECPGPGIMAFIREVRGEA